MRKSKAENRYVLAFALLFFLILLCSSASAVTTEYTASTATICDSGICTKTLYSKTMFQENEYSVFQPMTTVTKVLYDNGKLKIKWNDSDSLDNEIDLETAIFISGEKFEPADFPDSMNYTIDIHDMDFNYKYDVAFTLPANDTVIALDINTDFNYTLFDTYLFIDKFRFGFEDAIAENYTINISTYLKDDKEIIRINFTKDWDFYNVSVNDSVVIDPTLQLKDADTENLDDSYVNNSAADINYGASDILYHQNDTDGKITYAYFKYNLTYIINHTYIISITDSQFCTYQFIKQDRNTNVYHVYNDTWTEDSITWNNQPCGNLDDAVNCNLTAIDTYTPPYDHTRALVCYNVTDMITADWQAATSNETSMMIGSDSYWNDNLLESYSKERTGTTFDPYLTVSYSISTPIINSNATSIAVPIYGDTINITANVTDDTYAIAWCNFTLTDPNSIAVIDNENGTNAGDIWNSTNYALNVSGTWTVNITCENIAGATASNEWTFLADLGTLTVVPATKTFSQVAGSEELFNLTLSHTGNNNNSVDFNLTGDINISENFTITFEEDPTTVEESETQYIEVNITSNASLPEGTYTGNITYNRTNDGTEGVIEVTVYISASVGDVTMTPVSLVGVAMEDDDSAGRVLTINNTGNYALINCNLSIDSGLSSYTVFNVSAFTVNPNNETQISMILSNVPAGSYSAIVTATCTATAAGGIDTDDSSLSVAVSGQAEGGGSSYSLTIIQEALCGDGVCSGDETSESCPIDCLPDFFMSPEKTEVTVGFDGRKTGRIKIINNGVRDKTITVTVTPADYIYIDGDENKEYVRVYEIGRKVGLQSGEAYVEWEVDLSGTNLSLGAYDYILTFDDGFNIVSYDFTLTVGEPGFSPEIVIGTILGGLLLVTVAPPFVRKYKRGKKKR